MFSVPIRFISIALILSCCQLLSAHTCNYTLDEVRQSVYDMLDRYPEATLQDIYKSFFQDRFGPGHIISDHNQAMSYLTNEFQQSPESPCLLFEPTGCKGNFVRVSLDIARHYNVDLDDLLEALIISAEGVFPTVEQWQNE